MKPDPRAALDAYEKHREDATQKQRYRVSLSGTHVTCGRGCSNCCAQMVNIVLADALSIARWLIKSRPTHELRHLARRLQEDGEAQRPHGPADWLASDALRPCTFLGADGSCTVHAVRPVNCRRMLVSTPAAWCHPQSLLKVVRGASKDTPRMEHWPEFDLILSEAQEAVRPLLHSAGIKDDLPPAPLPLAVGAALHALVTGNPSALRSWAART